jgi:acetylornithine deacetylase
MGLMRLLHSNTHTRMLLIPEPAVSQVMGIGVDELVKQGMLQHLLPGPLYWIDTADSQPCIGTGGIAAWQLTAYGKLFHSGLPNKSSESRMMHQDIGL